MAHGLTKHMETKEAAKKYIDASTATASDSKASTAIAPSSGASTPAVLFDAGYRRDAFAIAACTQWHNKTKDTAAQVLREFAENIATVQAELAGRAAAAAVPFTKAANPEQAQMLARAKQLCLKGIRVTTDRDGSLREGGPEDISLADPARMVQGIFASPDIS